MFSNGLHFFVGQTQLGVPDMVGFILCLISFRIALHHFVVRTLIITVFLQVMFFLLDTQKVNLYLYILLFLVQYACIHIVQKLSFLFQKNIQRKFLGSIWYGLDSGLFEILNQIFKGQLFAIQQGISLPFIKFVLTVAGR